MNDRQSNRRARLPLAAAFVVLAGALFWPRGIDGPSATWRVEGAAAPGAIVAVDPATPFDLQLDLPTAAHVYVVSDDLTRGTIAHYPSAWLRSDVVTDAALPPGRVTLPGSANDHGLRWHSGDFSGPVAVAVLVSDQPIDSLDAVLAECRQMGNAAFPNREVLDAYAPPGPGAAVPAPSVGTAPTAAAEGDRAKWTKRADHPLLRRVFALTEQRSCGPMYRLGDGLFATVLRFDNRWPKDGDAPGIKDQVRDSLGGLMEAMPSPPAPPEGR